VGRAERFWTASALQRTWTHQLTSQVIGSLKRVLIMEYDQLRAVAPPTRAQRGLLHRSRWLPWLAVPEPRVALGFVITPPDLGSYQGQPRTSP